MFPVLQRTPSQATYHAVALEEFEGLLNRSRLLKDQAMTLVDEQTHLISLINRQLNNVKLSRCDDTDRADLLAIGYNALDLLSAIHVTVDEDAGMDKTQKESKLIVLSRLTELHEEFENLKLTYDLPNINNFILRLQTFLNAALPEPTGPIDERFQSLILGCNRDTQRFIRRRIQDFYNTCLEVQKEYQSLSTEELLQKQESVKNVNNGIGKGNMAKEESSKKQSKLKKTDTVLNPHVPIDVPNNNNNMDTSSVSNPDNHDHTNDEQESSVPDQTTTSTDYEHTDDNDTIEQNVKTNQNRPFGLPERSIPNNNHITTNHDNRMKGSTRTTPTSTPKVSNSNKATTIRNNSIPLQHPTVPPVPPRNKNTAYTISSQGASRPASRKTNKNDLWESIPSSFRGLWDNNYADTNNNDDDQDNEDMEPEYELPTEEVRHAPSSSASHRRTVPKANVPPPRIPSSATPFMDPISSLFYDMNPSAATTIPRNKNQNGPNYPPPSGSSSSYVRQPPSSQSQQAYGYPNHNLYEDNEEEEEEEIENNTLPIHHPASRYRNNVPSQVRTNEQYNKKVHPSMNAKYPAPRTAMRNNNPSVPVSQSSLPSSGNRSSHPYQSPYPTQTAQGRRIKKPINVDPYFNMFSGGGFPGGIGGWSW